MKTLTEEQIKHLLGQIETANKMENDLMEMKKPYIKEYRIVSRINRKLSRIRKEKKKLNEYIDKGVEEYCG